MGRTTFRADDRIVLHDGARENLRDHQDAMGMTIQIWNPATANRSERYEDQNGSKDEAYAHQYVFERVADEDIVRLTTCSVTGFADRKRAHTAAAGMSPSRPRNLDKPHKMGLRG
jgi:hypothetical protein